MTREGGTEVHKERVPPIIPCQEFDLLGLLARVDVPGVGSILLGREARLRPVERRVEHAVLEPEARKPTGEDLGDWRPRSLLELDICSRAGDERQSARLDESCAIVFTLDCGPVRTVLEVPRETVGQAGEVTLEI